MPGRKRAVAAGDRPIAELCNLGPVTARQLAEIGVEGEAALRDLGAVEAWRRLKFRYPREITRVALYALAGALLDLPWNALPPDLKAELDDAAATYAAAQKARR